MKLYKTYLYTVNKENDFCFKKGKNVFSLEKCEQHDEIIVEKKGNTAIEIITGLNIPLVKFRLCNFSDNDQAFQFKVEGLKRGRIVCYFVTDNKMIPITTEKDSLNSVLKYINKNNTEGFRNKIRSIINKQKLNLLTNAVVENSKKEEEEIIQKEIKLKILKMKREE